MQGMPLKLSECCETTFGFLRYYIHYNFLLVLSPFLDELNTAMTIARHDPKVPVDALPYHL